MTTTEVPLPELNHPRRFRRIAKRVAKVAAIAIVALVVAGQSEPSATTWRLTGPRRDRFTCSSRKAADGTPRYLEWGTHGTTVVLVPAAAETADTFAKLGPVLARNHRVFAIDLSGTGYSIPNSPFSASRFTWPARYLRFSRQNSSPRPERPHPPSATPLAQPTSGTPRWQAPEVVRGVVFLDGDATPLGAPSFLGAIAGTLFINPYKTSVLRLALSQDWLIKDVYNSLCGPTCPQLGKAGVNTWRWPLEQPGFQAELTYTIRHGITRDDPPRSSPH